MISLSRLHLTASPWVLDLLTHLWQSTVVALAILGLLAFCGGLSARTRRMLGWIGVAKFALPAAWMIALIERVGGTPKPWLASEAWLLPATTLPVARSAPVAAPDFPIGQILGAIWAVGAVGLLAWWMVRAMRARTRILQTAVDASAALVAQVAHAADRVGLREAPRCVIVEGDHGPGLVGIVSPTLVLPRGLAEALTPAELEAILIHENVHVRRRDNLWNAVRGGFVGLLWFNPVAWLLNRTLSLEMEKSCDERVLEITRDADTYARSIVASVRHTLGLMQPGLAGATTPPVVGRIKAIFAYSARRDQPMVRWAVLLAGVGLVALSGRAGSITADTPTAVAATTAPEQSAAPAATGAKAEPTMSVDFPDQNIRDILRNVADLFQLNVIMPETLQGKTTIKLRDVTWRQIFTVVLEPVGHAFVERDNTVVIAKNERKVTGYKIGTLAIKFAGVASVSEQAVRAAMQLREGGEFDERSLDRDVRAIYALGVFKTVEVKHEPVEGATVDLVLELTPKPATGALGSPPGSVSTAQGTLTFTPSNAPAAGATSFPNLNPNGGTLTLSGGANANTGVTFDVPAKIPSSGTSQVAPRSVQEELSDAQQKLAEANAELKRMRDEREAVVAKQKESDEARARELARQTPPAAVPPATPEPKGVVIIRPKPTATIAASVPTFETPAVYRGMKVFDTPELDQMPVARFQARPRYPFEMRKGGIGGEVVVDFIIDTNGDVQNAYALRSSRAEFEAAAVEAVSKWKFKPGRKGGRDVPTHMQVPIVFTLNER